MAQFRALLAVVCLSALAISQLPTAASLLPPVPAGIVHPTAPVIYHDLAESLWNILLATDIESTCNSAATCPCKKTLGLRVGLLPSQCSVSLTGARCGGTSRLWWRVVFHDCGTFNVNDNTGGCDGSIQHELKRPENGDGISGAITAYKLAIKTTMLKLHNIGKKKPSMADAVVIAGLLGLAKCGGPIIPFQAGLKDAPVANLEGLIAGDQNEPIDGILAKMARSSFSPSETVALVGAGHTMSQLNGRMLDATPGKFDNRFFIELAGKMGKKLNSDVAMLGKAELLQSILLFAKDEVAFKVQAVAAIKKMIALKPAVIPPKPKTCFLGLFC